MIFFSLAILGPLLAPCVLASLDLPQDLGMWLKEAYEHDTPSLPRQTPLRSCPSSTPQSSKLVKHAAAATFHDTQHIGCSEAPVRISASVPSKEVSGRSHEHVAESSKRRYKRVPAPEDYLSSADRFAEFQAESFPLSEHLPVQVSGLLSFVAIQPLRSLHIHNKAYIDPHAPLHVRLGLNRRRKTDSKLHKEFLAAVSRADRDAQKSILQTEQKNTLSRINSQEKRMTGSPAKYGSNSMTGSRG